MFNLLKQRGFTQEKSTRTLYTDVLYESSMAGTPSYGVIGLITRADLMLGITARSGSKLGLYKTHMQSNLTELIAYVLCGTAIGFSYDAGSLDAGGRQPLHRLLLSKGSLKDSPSALTFLHEKYLHLVAFLLIWCYFFNYALRFRE